MPIEHTHSFGRLIIKEAFTAMKKTSLSSYRNHALFALLALLFAACVFCLGCNSGSDSAANTRTRIGNTRTDSGSDGNTRTRTCAQTHKL